MFRFKLSARARRTLGGKALCIGFAEGHAGRLLADLAQNAGLSLSWTWMNSETRTCTILVSQNGDATFINEPGTPVTKSAWKRLGQDVRKNISSAGLVRVSGTLPPNSSSVDLQELRTHSQPAADNLRFRSLTIFGNKHKFKLGNIQI